MLCICTLFLQQLLVEIPPGLYYSGCKYNRVMFLKMTHKGGTGSEAQDRPADARCQPGAVLIAVSAVVAGAAAGHASTQGHCSTAHTRTSGSHVDPGGPFVRLVWPDAAAATQQYCGAARSASAVPAGTVLQRRTSAAWSPAFERPDATPLLIPMQTAVAAARNDHAQLPTSECDGVPAAWPRCLEGGRVVWGRVEWES